MNPPPASRLPVILGGLYRWKWWTSAALAAVLVFLVGDDRTSFIVWMLVALFALLLWVPILFRWVLILRRSGSSFREGLRGE